MSRRLIILASAILGLHVCGIVFLGTSHAGSILGNALQVFSSAFAAVMCFQASRRGRGLSRPFWLLAAYAMGCWSVANLGWSYYENWLHVEPARLSLVRILFDVQGVFFAIALCLALPAPTPSLSAEERKRTTARFCSPSDSRLFAWNESESEKSAPASS